MLEADEQEEDVVVLLNIFKKSKFTSSKCGNWMITFFVNFWRFLGYNLKICMIQECCKLVVALAIAFSLFVTLFVYSIVVNSGIPKRIRNKLAFETEEDIKLMVDEIGDDGSHIILFLQVSDIHLGLSDEGDANFRNFVENVVPMISPDFVINSGDVANSATETSDLSALFPIQSGPEVSKDQYIQYKELLVEFNLFTEQWIDVRGNHDCYGVPNIFKKEYNYFAEYAVYGNQSLDSVYFVEFDYVRIIVFDTSKLIGIKHPLNYYGIWRSEIGEKIRAITSQSSKRNILVSHYPISTVVGMDLTDFLDPKSNVSVLLSGHLHEVSYVRRENFLDLAADTMLRNTFRIAAVDNNVFSFTDVESEGLPYVLILNPPDARFITNEDDWEIMIRKNRVRCLIFLEEGEVFFNIETQKFEKNDITHSRLLIDDVTITDQMERDLNDTRLYTWSVNFFEMNDTQIHTIAVVATDMKGRTTTVQRDFSINGEISRQSFFSGTFRNVPEEFVFHAIIISLCSFFVFWLVVPKLLQVILFFVDLKHSFERMKHYVKISGDNKRDEDSTNFPKLGNDSFDSRISQYYWTNIYNILARGNFKLGKFLSTIVIAPFYKFMKLNLISFFSLLGFLVWLFALPIILTNNSFLIPSVYDQSGIHDFYFMFFWGITDGSKTFEFELDILSVLNLVFLLVLVLPLFLSVGSDLNVRYLLFEKYKFSTSNLFGSDPSVLLAKQQSFYYKVLLVLDLFGPVNSILFLYLFLVYVYYLIFFSGQLGYFNLLWMLLYYPMLILNCYPLLKILKKVFKRRVMSVEKTHDINGEKGDVLLSPEKEEQKFPSDSSIQSESGDSDEPIKF